MLRPGRIGPEVHPEALPFRGRTHGRIRLGKRRDDRLEDKLHVHLPVVRFLMDTGEKKER